MSDNDLIRRGDALDAVHEADSLEMAKFGGNVIADRIVDIPAVKPAPTHTLTLTLALDTKAVRDMLDKAEAEVLHLNTIAATIRVNTLRHGGTHEQADAFIRGEADFVSWMVERIKRAPTLAEALELPEIKALVEAARTVRDSYWYQSDGVIRGMYELEAALRRIAEGEE